MILAKTVLPHPGHGSGELQVELVAGRSAATTIRAVNPLKLLVPRSSGRSVWAFASSFGGGLVAGDRTRIDVRLKQGTTCLIGTQASTKVYRNPRQLPCGHTTRAAIGENSFLVFAPDPVTAFAESCYEQRQEFFLSHGAGLVLLDWFSSGRAARGERWAFRKYQSRTDVFVEGRRVFIDSIRLDDESGTLQSRHRTGRFNCMATLLFIGCGAGEIAGRMLEEYSARPVRRGATMIASASPIAGGAVLRIASEDVAEAGVEIGRQLKQLAERLGDDPWARKW